MAPFLVFGTVLICSSDSNPFCPHTPAHCTLRSHARDLKATPAGPAGVPIENAQSEIFSQAWVAVLETRHGNVHGRKPEEGLQLLLPPPHPRSFSWPSFTAS